MDLEPVFHLMKAAPITQGLPAVVDHFLEGTARLLPSLALGACVVEGNGDTPIVATLLPPHSAPVVERDPTRLFPGYADEAIFDLVDGATGSTFHLALQHTTLSSSHTELARRISEAFGPMLKHAREYAHGLTQTQLLARSQAKMIQTEKLASLGQIVAGVVHELNNPLTSIIAYSDFLKKGTMKRGAQGDDVADDLERLRRIGEAAERILKFSRDLVAYARPSTDIPGPVALLEVIEKALVFCEHEFSKNGIVVQMDIEQNLPPVRGIAGQLTQVFVNLFTNAAHAMHHAPGALEIDARLLSEETVLVQVADSGIGIPDEDLEQIFEPFYTTKVDGAGTGLGLSIVRDIVTQHGGDLTAIRRPARGTVFRLNLPIVVVPPSLRPPRP